MNLVIFDVDGTLVRTSDIDDLCFGEAVSTEWHIKGIDLNWSNYKYSTDSGISRQLHEEHYGFPPDERKISRLKDRYEQLLSDAVLLRPDSYSEVTGASGMLRAISSGNDWKVAVCSGAWRLSASIKLNSAGITLIGKSSAFADDALHRENIIIYAIARSFAINGGHVFEKIVYVGDSLWDLRAASSLKLAFIGVRGAGRGGLLNEGAQIEVLPGFTDYDRFVEALNSAQVPTL